MKVTREWFILSPRERRIFPSFRSGGWVYFARIGRITATGSSAAEAIKEARAMRVIYAGFDAQERSTREGITRSDEVGS